MVFAVGDEECKGQQLVAFGRIPRSDASSGYSRRRMTTVEGVRDAVDILSDFESLFAQLNVFSHCPRVSNVHHEYQRSNFSSSIIR